MNTTIPTLLVLTIATGLAPQQPKQSKPVDVSVEGLVEAACQTPDDTTRGGSIGLAMRSALDFDCLSSVGDQATGGCLTASSTATFGILFPYPGLDNVFTAPAFVGGGRNNRATGRRSVVGGGEGNTASGMYATIGGGQGNTASNRYATVGGGGGGFSNGNTASGDWATVAGGDTNIASDVFTTVGGGHGNSASGRYATVGGGQKNYATGYLATVGGGGGSFRGNDASGRFATIGGGFFNFATAGYATVAGGYRAVVSGIEATVGGGGLNTASGGWATIPGGLSNTALGNQSFAAGRRAKANHAGAFVWGDSVDGDKASSAPDEFNVYASGGVRMFTNSAATTGVLLAAGGSTWTMVSDRDAKENVEPVDARDVLDKVAQLPLATWNYKAQDDSIRHMGPMAQDFYAAFGLGLGEKTIDTIDPNGVALAAIQGLNAELEERLAEKDAEIEELRARLERLEALIETALPSQ